MKMLTNVKWSIAVLGLATTFVLGNVNASDAQSRQVIVNGVLLDAKTLLYLDRAVGGLVPDGAYWLDVATGIWGYAGDMTPQGQIGGGTYAQGSGVGEVYSGGASAYRNATTGIGVITDPNAGGCGYSECWEDQVFITD